MRAFLFALACTNILLIGAVSPKHTSVKNYGLAKFTKQLGCSPWLALHQHSLLKKITAQRPAIENHEGDLLRDPTCQIALAKPKGLQRRQG